LKDPRSHPSRKGSVKQPASIYRVCAGPRLVVLFLSIFAESGGTGLTLAILANIFDKAEEIDKVDKIDKVDVGKIHRTSKTIPK
jgi:hypothetical protein